MNKGLMIVKWTLACVLFVLLFGFIVMTLWNWLVPILFNGPLLNFWQALGLLLLCKILFGSFGGRHCGTGYSGKGNWKQRYYEKWSGMTPEDRERFKARMTQKWCARDKNISSEVNPTSND